MAHPVFNYCVPCHNLVSFSSMNSDLNSQMIFVNACYYFLF
uniref:Uncharacterized protein n=1 Tax=Anguilla anguilla TaxID=7936 RepID=A0A0E9VMN8_ANGAN